MTHYRFFGTCLQSEHALPLPPAAPSTALMLRFESDPATETSPPRHLTVAFRAEATHWHYRLTGTRGHWVDMRLSDTDLAVRSDRPWRRAAAFVVGVGARLVLARRAIPALHGGVIAAAGRALVLLGPSGAGKSSLIAAALRRGATMLSEDLAVPRPAAAGGFVLEPGAARLSLKPDSANALLPDLCRRATPRHGDRLWLPIDTGYGPNPVRLGAIIVLPRDETDTLRLERLDPRTTLIALLSNLHTDPAPPPERQALPLLAAMADAVPAFRLHRPWGLDRLDAVADAVLEILR